MLGLCLWSSHPCHPAGPLPTEKASPSLVLLSTFCRLGCGGAVVRAHSSKHTGPRPMLWLKLLEASPQVAQEPSRTSVVGVMVPRKGWCLPEGVVGEWLVARGTVLLVQVTCGFWGAVADMDVTLGGPDAPLSGLDCALKIITWNLAGLCSWHLDAHVCLFCTSMDDKNATKLNEAHSGWVSRWRGWQAGSHEFALFSQI